MRARRHIISGGEAFRHHLLSEYEFTCRKNIRYSLRAFASKLDVDSTTLSRILKGQRQISFEMFEHLARKIGLGPAERVQYLSQTTESLKRSSTAYRKISLDAFTAISDWYHFAIVELMRTKGFLEDPKWIAKKLGISQTLAHAAVERLERLGWIQITPEGKWIDCAGHNTTDDPDDKTLAYRKLQKQLLEKALEALDTIPFSQRDQSSMTVAVSARQLPQIKKQIDEFRRSLTESIETNKNRESVYTLLVSFFPLTRSLKAGDKPHEH